MATEDYLCHMFQKLGAELASSKVPGGREFALTDYYKIEVILGVAKIKMLAF